jgi:hypothetical protein
MLGNNMTTAKFLNNSFHESNILERNLLHSASEYTWLYIQIVFYALTFIIGIIGNFLVIFVIMMNSKLKTVTNMYLLQLAITDVVFLLQLPFAIVTLLKQKWVFNFFFCKLFWLSNGINQFTSIFVVIVLAFDR